jgi:glycosyltransferase involved in cell wall biosynthesis
MTHEDMRLSVVIPCYNGEETLADQLQALAEQKWSKPWEVVFADNGSTDQSRAIGEDFRNKLPNFRIVDASLKQGKSYALNVGTKAAKGTSVAFVDADDVVAPGWVAAVGNALEKYDFVACRWDTEILNPGWTKICRGNPQEKGIQQIWYPPYLPHAGGGGIGVKKTLHAEVGGFDETLLYLEDTDYCWKLQLKGTKLHFTPEAVIYIRFRPDLKHIYLQTKNYAEYNVLLSKRYASYGEPIANAWRRYFHEWKALIKQIRRLRGSIGQRARWLTLLGWQVGRLKGVVKYHVPPV